jgi:hypothetical protein
MLFFAERIRLPRVTWLPSQAYVRPMTLPVQVCVINATDDIQALATPPVVKTIKAFTISQTPGLLPRTVIRNACGWCNRNGFQVPRFCWCTTVGTIRVNWRTIISHVKTAWSNRIHCHRFTEVSKSHPRFGVFPVLYYVSPILNKHRTTDENLRINAILQGAPLAERNCGIDADNDDAKKLNWFSLNVALRTVADFAGATIAMILMLGCTACGFFIIDEKVSRQADADMAWIMFWTGMAVLAAGRGV